MKDFKQFVNALSNDWTLFLDRDGVINKRLPNEYVKTIHDFEFIEGVTESLQILTNFFNRIVVVTNQQGIGKKLMTVEMLETIHNQMIKEIVRAGGNIDKIYFCPQLDSDPANCRKPGSSMAFQAKYDFPEIEFSKSVMIGDSHSDIEFGSRLGMTTIFIGNHDVPSHSDFVFNSLYDLAINLEKESDDIKKKGELC